MKARLFAAPLLALTCLLAPPAQAAQSPSSNLPSADIPPPGPAPQEQLLAPRDSDRLMRDLSAGRPRSAGNVNNGYTAMCVDGTVSRSASPLDACLYHGGLDHWFGAPARSDRGRTAAG
jgi:hypothetical protein